MLESLPVILKPFTSELGATGWYWAFNLNFVSFVPHHRYPSYFRIYNQIILRKLAQSLKSL